MAKRNKPLPEWDDGRVICPMDVDGMPWKKEKSFFKKLREGSQAPEQQEKMSSQQARMYTAGALKAALLIISVFAVGLVLFTLFCTKIWFK